MTTVWRGLLAAVFIAVGYVSARSADDYQAPEFPRVITGKVSDKEGRPLLDALVEWGHRTDTPDKRETVRTDATGRYRLETQRVGKAFRLGVSCRGYAPWWREYVIPGPNSAPSEIDVQLQPGTNWSIKAVDGEGNPVTGFSVVPMTPRHVDQILSRFGPPPPPSTPYPGATESLALDAQGIARLDDWFPPPKSGIEPGELAPGEVFVDRTDAMQWLHLRFQNGDRTVHQADITCKQARESREITVVFPDSLLPGHLDRNTGVIRGRVIDQESRNPVPTAVVVRRFDVDPVPVDADGRFELGPKLTNLRQYEFRAFAPGYAVATAKYPAISPAELRVIDIPLTRSPSLLGRLTDAVSGEPLPNVQILSGVAKPRGSNYVEWSSLDQYADGHHGLTNVLRVTTDADGRFTIPESPGESTTLIVLTARYERRIIPPDQRPQPDDQGRVTIGLQPESTLTIVARRDSELGAQADSAYVGYTSADGFDHMYHSRPLDADGRLTLGSLSAGEYFVGLYRHADQVAFSTCGRNIRLLTGEQRIEELGKLPGEFTLSGWAPPLADIRIEGMETAPGNDRAAALVAAGVPVRDFRAAIPTLSDRIDYVVLSDVDGRFVLRGLLPGQYRIGPRDREWIAAFPVKTIDLQRDAQVILRPH